MDEQNKGLFGPGPDAPRPPIMPAGTTPEATPPSPQEPLGQMPPSPIPPPPKPDFHKEPRSKWLVYSIVALVILVLAAAAYLFLLKPKPAAKPVTSSNGASQTPTSQAQTPATAKISSTTKNYTSPNFNLAFSYPDDWTVTDSGGGVMTVKSPAISLHAASGQTTNGVIVLSIRNKAQKLAEFNAGNATATRNSQKVAYTKPTQTQRGSTYLSFLQYASTTTSGALDGIYITGDSGYQKGQAVPLVDISKVDPVISITFTDASGKALSITDSSFDDATFAGPLTTMLQSFSIN